MASAGDRASFELERVPAARKRKRSSNAVDVKFRRSDYGASVRVADRCLRTLTVLLQATQQDFTGGHCGCGRRPKRPKFYGRRPVSEEFQLDLVPAHKGKAWWADVRRGEKTPRHSVRVARETVAPRHYTLRHHSAPVLMALPAAHVPAEMPAE
jgi:hypothetical protein